MVRPIPQRGFPQHCGFEPSFGFPMSDLPEQCAAAESLKHPSNPF